MRQKKLRQLRKLSEYDCHATPTYKGKFHGIRERISSITVKANGKLVKIPITTKYRAVTIVNESKAKYKIAKKVFRELKKTYNQKT